LPPFDLPNNEWDIPKRLADVAVKLSEILQNDSIDDMIETISRNADTFLDNFETTFWNFVSKVAGGGDGDGDDEN
jgi:hypothetical protein